MSKHDHSCRKSPQYPQECRILVIDDDINILRSLSRVLAKLPYSVDYYDCVDEALCKARYTAYQLVISDQRMPKLYGSELLAEIKKMQPEALGIILSGQSDIEDLINAINQAQVVKFLSKPWDEDHLIAVVKSALQQYQINYQTQRLADSQRVQIGSVSKNQALLNELETLYPGITKIERGADGAIIIKLPKKNRTG